MMDGGGVHVGQSRGTSDEAGKGICPNPDIYLSHVLFCEKEVGMWEAMWPVD
ncbi:hypothetical protein PLACP1_16390 [Planifilum fimeticola]